MADKVLFPDISEEKIYVCLEEVSGNNIRFDLIPKPTRIWSDTYEFDSLKELPEKGARKDKTYKTEDESKADTFVYNITPENLTLLAPTRIMMRVIECVLGSKGFVFICFSGFKETNKDLEEFKALLLEEQKEYSGIQFRDFVDEKPREEELLCWMKEN